MDPAALAGLCLLLARGEAIQPLPPGVTCPPIARAPASPPRASRGDHKVPRMSAEARDAIARVTFAEAGNQGDSGLAAVVYTILNRLADGRWGSTVDGVLNARLQFEPVMRAGGDWRNLPAVSAAAQARVDTILNLALEGRLPDLTGGARFFQNPAIVTSRARAGRVPARLVNFGGATPSVVIGAHSFYVDTGRGGQGARVPGAGPQRRVGRTSDGLIFVGDNRGGPTSDEPQTPGGTAADLAPPQPSAGDPSRGLFVGRDGQVSAQPF
jgi:N-acetylmuramoyl-L-alanine amidase